jgi:hypothetical protein
MTLGTIRFRVKKMFPGLDSDVMDGYIGDCYAELAQALPWKRQKASSVLQTVAPYATGTVAVTNGSNAVTFTGATITAGMTGRRFRVTGQSEYYTFTYVSASTGTLDRVYEGTTDADATYSIEKAVYALPANCRFLEDDAFSDFSLGPLTRLTIGELNAAYPSRSGTGTPQIWVSVMDDASSPPLMQVELYPVPDEAIGIPYAYLAEPSEVTSATAGTTLLAIWMNPAALIEGVSAKVKRLRGDYAGAIAHEAAMEKALRKMIGVEADRMEAVTMTLPDRLTDHRVRRWSRT